MGLIGSRASDCPGETPLGTGTVLSMGNVHAVMAISRQKNNQRNLTHAFFAKYRSVGVDRYTVGLHFMRRRTP